MEKTPQSKRLKEFIDLTGYSLTEFSNQCGISSTSTLHKVVTNGNNPSSKLLDKIINRFPQLNHDWVVLGYGEMIVKGLQTQETSAASLKKSNESSYQYIMQALRDHDFALNELSLRIEKALLKSDQISQNMDAAIEKTFDYQKLFLESYIEKLEHRLEKTNTVIIESEKKIIETMKELIVEYLSKAIPLLKDKAKD